MNQKPIDSRYKKGVYRAHFDNKICGQCPNKLNCPINRQKNNSLLEVSETKLHRIKLIAQMGTKEYRELANKRAGVEGIPSVLRRRYGIDKLPVRGLVRSKLWLGFKISAINCKRLIKGAIKTLKDSLLHIFQYHLLDVFSFRRPVAVKLAA